MLIDICALHFIKEYQTLMSFFSSCFIGPYLVFKFFYFLGLPNFYLSILTQNESPILFWILLIELLFYPLGPVMTKFTIALREIGTYKEVLRSQVIPFCCICDLHVKFFLQANWFFFFYVIPITKFGCSSRIWIESIWKACNISWTCNEFPFKASASFPSFKPFAFDWLLSRRNSTLYMLWQLCGGFCCQMSFIY